MTFSLPALADRIRTEADAYEFLEELRWDGKPVCPHCGEADRKPYFLTPKNGQRSTRTGTKTDRRVWKCASCRKQFSALTGTIFHGTKIPVRTWLFVVFEMCSSKNGVAAREIERKYQLTPKSAWFMLHRIREAMKRQPLAGLLTGPVESDEAYIGGKPSNRHGHDPKANDARMGGTDKVAVHTLVSRTTGEVRSRVIPDVTGDNLKHALSTHTDPKRTHLHTDKHPAYPRLAADLRFAGHSAVDHGKGEYVRGAASTNMAEGFFSQLKRSIDGTHHHVSREHLPRYLAEFDFRYSTRKMDDTKRTERMMGQVAGRRLTYRESVRNVRQNRP
jgi:transposase-like protein